MKITTASGHEIMIDDEDWDIVKEYSWRIATPSNCTYAVATPLIGNKNRNVLMHRLILSAADRMIDHIDGNGLNNHRDNLRFCSHSQNAQNSRKHYVASSRFKGVSWERDRGKWRVQITISGKQKRVGRFLTEKDAAAAYNKAAVKAFGEFARLNQV